MKTRLVIGMDIGGTHIRIGAGNGYGYGELQEFIKIPRAQVLDGTDTAEKLTEFIQNYIDERHRGTKIDAIAIGFPSTLSKDRRTILQTPNIEGINNLPIADILEGKLGIKVYLERDTNFLFYKDVQAKNLPVKGIAVGIYVGTGVGNAIFVDGKPLLGKDGVVGEIGHIPFLGGEDICGCGNKGCAECYASGRHLSALKDQYFKETVMDDLFSEHRENSVLKDFVDKIACVVATVINILNPEYIILGGGVIGMKDFPKEYLEKCIRIHTRKPYPEQNLSIYYADDTVEDGVRGAIFYVLDNCLKDKSGL